MQPPSFPSAMSSGASGLPGNSNLNAPSSSQLQQEEAAKNKMKQQRILLLRHASKCPYGDPSEGGNGLPCPIAPNCNSMKTLWKHMTACVEPSNRCNYPHCNSSKYVMAHYRKCTDPLCTCCEPVRAIIRKQQQKKMLSQSTNIPASGPGVSFSISPGSNNTGSEAAGLRTMTPSSCTPPVDVDFDLPDPTPLSSLQQSHKPMDGSNVEASTNVMTSSSSSSAMHRMPPQSSLSMSFHQQPQPQQHLSSENSLGVVPFSNDNRRSDSNVSNSHNEEFNKKRKVEDITTSVKSSTPSSTISFSSTSFSSAVSTDCTKLLANHSIQEVESFLGALKTKLEQQQLLSSTVNTDTKSALIRTCQPILNHLQSSHAHSWVFMAPVDPIAFGLHDYFAVISTPMDLGTISNKLANGQYASVEQFAFDVKLTFDNAMQYNPEGTEVHIWAKEMKEMLLVEYSNMLLNLM